MKNLTLYPEIKAAVARSREAEHNAKEWKMIAKEEMGEARTLIAAAKKIKANSGIEFTANTLIDFINEELDRENAPKSEADTDLTDYAPGDIPANNAPGSLENPIDPTKEEDPNESSNL